MRTLHLRQSRGGVKAQYQQAAVGTLQGSLILYSGTCRYVQAAADALLTVNPVTLGDLLSGSQQRTPVPADGNERGETRAEGTLRNIITPAKRRWGV